MSSKQEMKGRNSLRMLLYGDVNEFCPSGSFLYDFLKYIVELLIPKVICFYSALIQ